MSQMSSEIIVRHCGQDEFERPSDRTYDLKDIASLRREFQDIADIDTLHFLTGNKNKISELRESLNLRHIELSCTTPDTDIPEIQDADVLTIVEDKCKRAYETLNRDRSHRVITLVEDTSLNFDALGGLPGPYVKWFLNAVGPIGLHKMLSGFANKKAKAVCVYALMPNHQTILFFRGVALGEVVEPLGTSGWGWDPVFLEERSGLTFGQMDTALKSKFSHRASAVKALRTFLESFERNWD